MGDLQLLELGSNNTVKNRNSLFNKLSLFLLQGGERNMDKQVVCNLQVSEICVVVLLKR